MQIESSGGPPGTKKVEATATMDVDVKTAKKELAKLIEGEQPKKKKKKVKPAEVILVNPLSQDAPLSSNDIGGKKKLTKAERKAAAKRALDSAAPGIVKTLQSDAKAHTAVALQTATNAFIDGPVADVCNAFVALFLSARNPVGDSPEAVATLDACRVAFDACGLILTDVETKTDPAKQRVSTDEPKSKKKAKRIKE